MKFGVNTLLWTGNVGHEHLSLLPLFKKQGFDGFEVPLFDPPNFIAKDIRRAAENAGLECTVCTVLHPNQSLITDEPVVRRTTISHLIDLAEMTAEAGSRILAGPVFCPLGYLPGRRRTEDEWRRAVESYKILAPAFAQFGVTLAIEPLNRFETFFLNTAADARQLCDEVNHPSVGILLDTFHANIEEKNIGAAYRTCGKHLKHVHTCENDRGTPGSGHIEWDGIFAAIKEIGYDGWLTIESFGSTIPEIATAACIWRDLAGSSEELAREGLKFLKSKVSGRAASAQI